MKSTKIEDDAQQMRHSGRTGYEPDPKGKKSFVRFGHFYVFSHQNELVLICLERYLMPARLPARLAAVNAVSCLDQDVMTEPRERERDGEK